MDQMDGVPLTSNPDSSKKKQTTTFNLDEYLWYGFFKHLNQNFSLKNK